MCSPACGMHGCGLLLRFCDPGVPGRACNLRHAWYPLVHVSDESQTRWRLLYGNPWYMVKRWQHAACWQRWQVVGLQPWDPGLLHIGSQCYGSWHVQDVQVVAAGGSLADVAAVGLHADVKPPEAVDAVVRVVRRLREQTQARTPRDLDSCLKIGLLSSRAVGCRGLVANH